MTDKDILDLIREDNWMMDILKAAESLDLPDWWIGAGFIRDKVWDYLSGYKQRTPLNDIDIIYFDKLDFSPNEENSFSTKSEDIFQEKLNKLIPNVGWSVTNQARMHLFHKTKPYKNSEDALSEWSETTTCIAVNLRKGKLSLITPYGVDDLVNLILRPIPNYKEKFAFDPKAFERRIKEKRWKEKWPKLKTAS
jgi:hypothetical protein